MVYNKTAGVIVTCNDARSLAMKGKLIKDMGLRCGRPQETTMISS
jgi:GH18 family chitinase